LKEATSEIAPAEKLETPTSKDEQEAIPSEESPAPAETSEHAEEEATQVAVEEEEMPVTPVEEPLAPTEETTVPVEETAASAEQSPEPAEEKAEDTPAAIETPAAAEEEKDSVTFEETPGSVETSEPVEETPIPVEEAAASVEDQIPAHVEEKPENTPEAEVVEMSTPAETPAPIEAEPEASEEKVEEPVLAEPVKEEDDIVLVNHDEAKPEDVVAAEAAAIPELEEAVPEKVEDALVSAEEKETEKVADLSTEDEQPLEESEAQKAESSDAVAIESAQDLSEEVNVDPIPVVDAESIHDHVKLDQEAYESTEPTVPLELLEEERESDTPIEQVADTAAEVADVAQELDQAIPTEEAKAPEAPEPTEDLSQEVKIVPLPASEYAENPIYLEPGEPVPVDLRTASIDKNVRLDKESYEGAELTIPAIPTEPAEDTEVSSKLPAEGLSEAVGVSPLPASEGSENPIHLEPGEPIPKDINTASIDEHVKLDKESYESTEPNVPITSKEPTEEALLGEDLSEEAGISPLPASENAENPIHLEPGESIPEDIRAASIDKDVKLDKESYESTEPTVPIAPKELAERTPPETVKRDIDEEFEVSPLPAYENAENPIQLQPGEPIPDNVTTASIHDNVTLDQESYESATPIVPLKVVELERKSDTPIQEVAETAAEVADVAQKLDEPEEVATKGIILTLPVIAFLWVETDI